MAEFRTIQTRMWREDEWFQSLEIDARLLWMYLFSNPSANAAGLYRLPIRTIAFESGIEQARAEAILDEFERAGKAHYENGVVFVVNMQKLQHPEISWQVATRIADDVDAVPDSRLKDMYLRRYGYPSIAELKDSTGKITRTVAYQYPTDTPSMPHRYTDTDTDTDTKENDDDAGAQAVKGAIRAFENQIGLLSGAYQSGEMTAIVSELHERGTLAWWDAALKIACDNNARKWSYVRAILENSLKTGIAPGTKPPTAERRHGNGTNKPRVDPAVAAARRKAADEFDNAAALARI